MATDYDAPRKNDDDIEADSIEELKNRRGDTNSGKVDVDETEQAARRDGQCCLGRACLSGIAARRHRGVAGLDHLGERLLLVAHGVLHDLDEVRDEIVAPLELDVDL